jgi:uncharacterized protein (TIGR03435 family)
MAARALSVLFAIVTSMFGQVPLTVKAGDPAPNLTWTKIVASTPTSAGPRSLLGQTSVLLFLPPVSHNEEMVSTWNTLVEEFADKHVNFVWITNEPEESLAPFLKSHPVRGWLVLDPQQESYKSYGIEGGDCVFVDRQGMIIGFSSTPNREQIQAAPAGRVIVIKGEPTEEQKDAFFEGKAVRLEAEPFRFPAPPPKPELPPSEEVHISPGQTEGTVSSSGPDHWMRRGFELKAILAEISGTTASRIELPAALDKGERYDFVLVPPREEDEETMHRRVREGFEKYFRVTITPAIRPADVYVMTAVQGKTPPAKSGDDAAGGGFISVETRELVPKLKEGVAPTRQAVEEAMRRAMDNPEFRDAMAAAQLTGMTALSSSVDEVRRALEDGLHRPILDETGLTGVYDFKIQGEPRNTEEFLGMLHDQLGLVITPTRRSIETMVVRPVE